MIRQATIEDINGIISLLYQVHAVHAKGRPDIFKTGGIKYTEENVKEIISNENTPVFVLTDEENTVLGYSFCEIKITEEDTSVIARKTLYIDDLCVDESLRGKHVGKELYDSAVKLARESGCYNLTLNVWSCNPSAMKFYEKMGLVPQKIGMELIL